MRYIKRQDLSLIHEIIENSLTHSETVPDYTKESEGVNQWESVLNSTKARKYYPRFFDKATKLLIDVNKGHFFSNGNKRLALVTALLFVYYNGYRFHDYQKKKYRKYLKDSFPECTTYQDFSFLPVEFAYYNLSIIIASHNIYSIPHPILKERVKSFLEFSIYKELPATGE